MNETGYTVLKLSKFDGAFVYAKKAREFATGATGAGGYLNAQAVASGWYDVEFANALHINGGNLPTVNPSSSSIQTGAAVVIGGATPIGDLRGESDGYIAIGGSTTVGFEKGTEYSGAFYAIYKGTAGNWQTGKIGIGTVSSELNTSGYYEGNYTTRNIHEFETFFDTDETDLTKITTGSGVYTDGDSVSLQFTILNRNGEKLSSSSQIAADPFISGQRISILNSDGSVAFDDYRIGGDSIFNFTRSQNVDVFGSYTRNFGIRNEVVNQDGGTHTSEFYLYANTATFDKIFVKSSGQTVLNENYANISPPDTSSIASDADKANAIKYFNNQTVNTTGVTGFIEFDLGFNENPNFTNLGNVLIFQGTSGEFETNRGSLVGNYPLNSIQAGQKIRLTANDGIPEGTGLFFKLAADTEVGFNEELFNLGPFTLEPVNEGPDLNVYNRSIEQQIIVSDVSVQGGVGGVGTQGGHFAVGTSAVGSTTMVIQGPPAPIGSAIGSTTVVIQGNDSKVEIANNEGFAVNSEQKTALASIGGSIFSTGSMIAGGSGHFISGDFDTIAGGAVGNISGGDFNFIGAGSGIDIVSSKFASSLGGQNNDISGADRSVILGGDNNYIATGQGHFLGGGSSNEISGTSLGADINNALVGGIDNRILNCQYGFIGAGGSNTIFKSNSVIGGGSSNIASGDSSVVFGGTNNQALANKSVAAGAYSKVQEGHHGAFVFSDSSATTALSTGANTFNLHFADGVYVTGNSGIFINGNPVVTGSTAVGGSQTLQEVTDAGNTTTNSILSTGPHISGVTGLFADRVGIGVSTVAATSTLELASGRLLIDAAGGVGEAIKVNNSEIINFDLSTVRADQFRASAVSNQLEFRGASNRTRFLNSSSTEVFTITNDGEIGVGVTDPDTKLEVDGNIKISAGKFYRIAGNEYQVGTDGVPSRLQLHAGGSERISISGDGKVGIGTTVPESLVHIYGGNSTQTFSNVNAGLAIENGGSSASHYVFQTATAGGGKSFSITNAGDVGIGTTLPAPTSAGRKALHVADTSNGVEIRAEGNGSTVNIKALSEGSIGTQGADKFHLQTNNSNRITINTDGHVGIGTTTPVAHLNVYNTGTTSSTADVKIVGSGNTYGLIVERLTGDSRIVSKSTSGSYFMTDSAVGQYQGFELDNHWFAGLNNFGGGYDFRIVEGTKSAADSSAAITIKKTSRDVGIGTTNPSTRLEIQKNSPNPPLQVRPSDGSAGDLAPLILYRDHLNGAANYLLAKSTHTYFGTFNGGAPTDESEMVKISPNSSDAPSISIGDDGSAAATLNVGGNISLVNNSASFITGGNVGIGTTGPQTALQIQGITTFDGDGSSRAEITSSTASSIVSLDVGGFDGSPSLARDVRFLTNPASSTKQERMRITSAGNVGIATGDPPHKLSVQGTISRINSNGIQVVNLQVASEAGQVSVLNHGGVEKALIHSNGDSYFNGGNVGIGTASPTTELAVAGTISGVSGQFDQGLFVSGVPVSTGSAAEADTLQTVTDRGSTTTTSISIGDDLAVDTDTLFVDASTDRVGINRSSLTTYDLEVRNGAGGSSNLGIIGGSSSSLVLNNTDTSIVTVPAAQMFLRATGGFFFQSGTTTRAVLTKEGDFGIGTASPSDKFHVEEDGGTVTIGSPTTSYGGIGFEQTALTAANSALYGVASQTVIGVKAGGAIEMKIANNSSLGLLKMEQDKLHYTNGNFGIGTGDPQSNLHVYAPSSAPTFRMSRASNGQVWVQSIDSSARFQLSEAASEGGTQNLRFQIDDAGETLLAPNGGDVGIGTTSPSANGSKTTLHINSDTNGAAIRLSQASNSSLIRYDDTNGLQVGTIASKNLSFETADTTAITIDTSQNVGIGTTSPSRKVSIFQSDSSLAYLQFANSTTTAASSNGLEIGINSDEQAVFFNRENTDMIFRTNNTDRLRILAGGNVGIGTTNPTTKLNVGGEISGSNSFLGTGVGNRITNNHVPYLLSGDIAAEADTLQTVTNRGATTTNAVQLNGGVVINENQSDLDFRVESNNDSHTLFVDGSTDNVGINNNNPQSKLDIRLTGTNSHLMDSGNVNTLLTLRVPNNSNPASVSNSGAKWGIKLRGAISDATQTNQKIAAIYGVSEDTLGYNRKVGMALHTSPFDADNVERVRIDCDGNVGIGTDSPTDILTINQTADSNGIRINGYDDHSSSFVKLFVDNNGHAELSQSTNGGDGYLELKAENYLQLNAGSFVFTDDEFRIYDAGQLSLGNGADFKLKYDSSTDKLKIHSSSNDGITMDVSGKVGIGTDSPTYELDVNGNIGVNEYIYHNDNDTTYLRFGPSTNRAILVAGNTSIFDTNNEDFLVGTDAFFVDIGNDRVGVANTNPQHALDVSGDVAGTGVGSRITLNGTPYLVSGDVATEADTLQSVTNRGATTTNAVQLNGGVVINEGGSDLDFRVEGDTATHALFVNGADNHVGLGTATPSSDFTVYSSDSNSATASIHCINNNETGALLRLIEGNNHQGGFLQFDGSANKFNIGVHSTNDTTFANDTKAITIDRDTASVGIGTTNPPHKLSVKGTISRTNSSNIQVVNLKVSSEAGQVSVLNAGGTEKVLINSNGDSYFDGGNVGIGTTDPAELLHVDGNILIPQGKTLKGYYGGSLPFDIIGMDSTTDTHIYGGNNNSSDIFFDTHNGGVTGTKMTILNAGNVGIGTTNPSEKLTISGGNILLTDRKAGDDGPQIKLAGPFCTWQIENQYVNGATNDMFRIRNATLGSDALVINRQNNRVGIGTTNPQSPLEVINDSSDDGITLKDDGGGLVTRIGSDGSHNARARFYNGSHALVAEINANAGSPTYFNAGDVGIGTSSPDGILNTSGDHVLFQGVNKGYVRVRTQRANTSDYANVSSSILTLANYFGQGEYGQFVNNAGNFRIQKSGNDGYLELDDNDFNLSGIRLVFDIANQAPTNLAINLRDENADEVGFYSPATNEIGFVTDRTERMRIDADGNVGIGATDPAATTAGRTALHVKDTSDGAEIRVEGNGSIVNIKALTDGFIGTQGTDKLHLQTNNSNKVTIDHFGRVGIGTTDPTKELVVNGNTLCSGDLLGTGDGQRITKNHVPYLLEGDAQAPLTFGISNTNAVKIDSSSVADDEYARFTANGLESRSTSEVLSDIGAQASLTFGISNTNAVKIDSTTVTDNEYARFTANGLESRSTSEVLSDIGALTAGASTTDVFFRTVQTNVYAIGDLPSASPAGKRAFVQLNTSFGSSVIGSSTADFSAGSTAVPIYSDGSVWRLG